MSQLIYRNSSADSPWIKQGNRLVKTWPSGLCLIQQDYIAPTALVDYDVFKAGDALNDSSPCVGSAYIYPTPEYQQLENGFTKCTVSAYGRINSTGLKNTLITESTYLFENYIGDGPETKFLEIACLAENLIIQKVVRSDDTPSVPSISRLKIFNRDTFEQINEIDGFFKSYIQRVSRYEENDFGYYKEITLVIKPAYTYSHAG
jgi:hypothetical protein